jgi:hypothetical protein
MHARRFVPMAPIGAALCLLALSVAVGVGPYTATPASAACDFYHPQDCTVSTVPPGTPVAPTIPPAGTIQPVGGGACSMPPAPGSPINGAFQQQWQQGESFAPNFWGPTYTAGFNEPYKEGSTGFSESGPTNPGQGMRLVQYFDKGRMELTHPASGQITNGLLANELITGQLQLGDSTFEQRAPANIPIAGDPDNVGPTYAMLGTKGKGLFEAAPQQTGNYAQAVVSPTGDISVSSAGRTDAATFAVYDDATKHNVPKAFADYRTKVGLLTIGYARSEPFMTTVKVAGTQRQVMVQVFERRVLTYTPTNPAAFQVEMGNIGQHYYRWRYCAG